MSIPTTSSLLLPSFLLLGKFQWIFLLFNYQSLSFCFCQGGDRCESGQTGKDGAASVSGENPSAAKNIFMLTILDLDFDDFLHSRH